MKTYFVNTSGIGYLEFYLVQAENPMNAVVVLEKQLQRKLSSFLYMDNDGERIARIAEYNVKEISEGQTCEKVFDMDDPNYEG